MFVDTNHIWPIEKKNPADEWLYKEGSTLITSDKINIKDQSFRVSFLSLCFMCIPLYCRHWSRKGLELVCFSWVVIHLFILWLCQSLWWVVVREWEGSHIWEGDLNRKTQVVLGEKVLNKVCSYKITRTITIESEFSSLGEIPLSKWRCTEHGYQFFVCSFTDLHLFIVICWFLCVLQHKQ